MNSVSDNLIVSALLVTRVNNNGDQEILNVLAKNKTKYGFPGGKLEKGETPLQAVVRETEEEIGVTPTNVSFVKTSLALTPEGRGIEMHIFKGEVDGDLHPQNEIAEIHWLTYEQMKLDLDLLTPMTIEHVLPILDK